MSGQSVRSFGKLNGGSARGIASRERMMHGGAERIQIRARFGASAILLRRRIALRADHGGVALRQEKSRDTEIDQLDLPVAPEHHIRRFQIAIHHRWLEVMQVLQRIEDLQRDVDDARLAELAAAALELVLERDASTNSITR